MFEVDWNVKTGWSQPKIVPYHNLSLAPSVTSLHYSLQCFEGLKAYSDTQNKGESYLFRPDENAKRFYSSCQRIALPEFDIKEFIKCLAELVYLEKDWIPKKRGYSLYIRPTMISTSEVLGVAPPTDAKMFIIMSPVGPYFSKGFVPVKLWASDKYVRAFPGGTGAFKIGANYCGTLVPQREALKKGYDQVLWLYSDDYVITEVGTMNMFFFWINENGEKELITADLKDGTILPGVTRMTVIDVAKSWGIKVNEGRFTMKQIIKAQKENRIIEAFGAGTAAIVAPVQMIHFQDVDIQIPVEENGLTKKLRDHILAIQHGEIESNYTINIKKFLNK